MRAVLFALVLALVGPSIALAHHGHLKKLCAHHQQHKYKHQLKKALKEGCQACEAGGHGHHGHGHHGQGHKLLHHHK